MIVDHSPTSKRILVRAVEGSGVARVEHTASAGATAVERLRQSALDVVLLVLPEWSLDLVPVLETLRREYPEVAVIIAGDGSTRLLRTLTADAMGFIPLPPDNATDKFMERITKQLEGLFAQINTRRYLARETPPPVPVKTEQPEAFLASEPVVLSKSKEFGSVDLVLMAASTGGPLALEKVCSRLPADFSKPILVVQHMPSHFMHRFAHSLGKKSTLPVAVGQEGDVVKPGRIVLAPDDVHMTVNHSAAGKIIKLEATPRVNSVRPAADVLFRSVAETYAGGRILVLILTGMGSDGMLGLQAIKRTCACYCLTQSENTCTVYGMPKSVVEAGLANEVADLDLIPARLLQLAVGRSS